MIIKFLLGTREHKVPSDHFPMLSPLWFRTEQVYRVNLRTWLFLPFNHDVGLCIYELDALLVLCDIPQQPVI